MPPPSLRPNDDLPWAGWRNCPQHRPEDRDASPSCPSFARARDHRRHRCAGPRHRPGRFRVGQGGQAAEAHAHADRHANAHSHAADPGRAARRPPRLELRHRAVPVAVVVGRLHRLDGLALPGLDPRAARRRRRGRRRRRARTTAGRTSRSRRPGRGRTSTGTTRTSSSRPSTRSTPPASRSGSRSSRPSATCRC